MSWHPQAPKLAVALRDDSIHVLGVDLQVTCAIEKLNEDVEMFPLSCWLLKLVNLCYSSDSQLLMLLSLIFIGF